MEAQATVQMSDNDIANAANPTEPANCSERTLNDKASNVNTSNHQSSDDQPADSNARDSHSVQDSDTCDVTTTTPNDSPTERRKSVTTEKTLVASHPEEVDGRSEASDISDLSEESWHPVQGPIAWVQEQMRQGHSPRKILEDLVPAGTVIPSGLDPIMLWKIIIGIVSEPPKRRKLESVNTLDDVVRLLRTSKKIMVLTGAGVSVSCGIPDFRSRDGVYARLSVDFPNLPDPQAMFDIHFFHNDPRPFFKFAKEIYPGQFLPSPCHHFIRLLESKGKLLRNYTQNIDTLEQVAGIEKVIQCHGSFATATCAVCGLKVNSDVIKDDIFKQVIPLCPDCPKDNERAVMKPDIVFFGESLPEDFHNQMALDKDECDLLIVIGSSLKVRPVALIPNSLPPDVPQILINRERLNYLKFDVELLGNCDDIVGDLCRRLGEGWDDLASSGPPLKEVDMASLPTPPASPPRDPCVVDAPSSFGATNNGCDTRTTSSSSNSTSNGNVLRSDDSSHGEQRVTHHPPHHHPPPCASKCADSSGQDGDNANGDDQAMTSDDQAMTSDDQATTSAKSKESDAIASSSSASPAAKATCSSSTTSCDQSADSSSSQNSSSCKTGSINCGITPHHKQDVMFCPCKGAPHSLTKQPISNQGPSSSPSSAQQHHPHPHHHHHKNHNHHHHPSSSTHHHGCEKRKLPESQDQEKEGEVPREKQPRLEEEDKEEGCSSELVEQPDKAGVSAVGAEAGSRSADSPERQEADSSIDEEIRRMWRSRPRTSLAQRLAEDQVLFIPPCRYVFKGAEVFSDNDGDSTDDSSSASSSSSSSSSSEEEEEEEEEEGDEKSKDHDSKEASDLTKSPEEKEALGSSATNNDVAEKDGSGEKVELLSASVAPTPSSTNSDSATQPQPSTSVTEMESPSEGVSSS